jgi:hypothetical protein
MKKSRIYACVVISLAFGSLLSSCVTDENAKKAEAQQAKPVVATPVAPPSPPPETPEQMAEKAARAAAQEELDNIIALYNNGDYHGEIKRFTSPNDLLKPYKDLEIQGLKYTAFSYCLIGKLVLCKQQFEHAFKLDPSFALAKGEQNHPIWGKVFDRVKKKEAGQAQ